MSRQLSARALQSLHAQSSGEALLTCVKITSSTDVFRLVNNPKPIMHQGEEYLASHFELELPEDTESVPRVKLRIANVHRLMTDWVRSLDEAPEVQFFMVLASQSEVIDVGPYFMSLREVSYDAMFIEGTLYSEAFMEDPFPGWIITPQGFPGMY